MTELRNGARCAWPTPWVAHGGAEGRQQWLVTACAAVLLALAAMLASMLPAAAQEAPQASDRSNRDDEIIYIDSEGYVRVLDPQAPVELPPLILRSPDSGWADAVVADVNGDTDDEIIVIRGDGLLKVYDPIVATLTTPDGRLFWEPLYETMLPGPLLLVAVGNLDGNPQTPEVVAVFRDQASQTRSRIQVLYQPGPLFDGRTWAPLTDVTTRSLWSSIAVGDVDGDGRAEIALVNDNIGALNILRREPNNVLRSFWNDVSDLRPWTAVAIGDVEQRVAPAELVGTRNAPRPLASLVVQRYRPVDQFTDVLLRDFSPGPRVVFLADITGNGEQEIFMLRALPADDTRARLFMVNLGTDAPATFEVRLDADNGYRNGAAGDINADGKDEIAVIRNNAILLFPSPATTTANPISYTVASNQRTLVMGNLDALGRDLLGVRPSTLQFDVAAGTQSDAQTLTINNLVRGNTIPFSVNLAPFTHLLRVEPLNGSTPASLTITVDARTLLPLSVSDALLAGAGSEASRLPVMSATGLATPTYGANLVISALDPLVANSPITLPIFVTVGPGVVLRPGGIGLMLTATDPVSTVLDCQPQQDPFAEIQVLGTVSSTFEVNVVNPGGVPPLTGTEINIGTGAATDAAAGAAPAVIWPSVVPWVQATSPAAHVPSTILLNRTATPIPWDAPDRTARAELLITGVLADGAATPFTRRVPITVNCSAAQTYVPVVLR